MNRAFHVAGWGFVALCTVLAARGPRPSGVTSVAASAATAAPEPVAGGESAPAAWFRRMRPYCNAVEIDVVQRQAPAPAGTEGQGYRAACYALAGRIDDARRVIDALPADQRAAAANVVFNVGHPVADAGDDRAAGPIMELVIDYWPNHYMALYHAGMAEYMLGQHELAQHNLEAFLRLYDVDDGWHANAVEVLGRLRDPDGRGRDDKRRPREPGS
jgi:tetratricopeptide (TPR) repeat protein